MPRNIVYPGTFDPIHNGHIDLIKRIAAQYDHVIVAVAKDTGSKKPVLTYEQRVNQVSLVIKELGLSNVEVAGFEGNTVKFAQQRQAGAILRGLRDANDIPYESVISNVTRSVLTTGLFQPPIEVVCLISDHRYKEFSSTKVRERLRQKLDVSDLVPSSILPELKGLQINSANKPTNDTLGWKYKAADNLLTLWYSCRKEVLIAGACGLTLGAVLTRAIG